jgi:hypothetical protein
MGGTSTTHGIESVYIIFVRKPVGKARGSHNAACDECGLSGSKVIRKRPEVSVELVACTFWVRQADT